jgi:SNF2 family DNA or RNA helicase
VCPKKIREQWVEQIQMQAPGLPIYILDRAPVDLSLTYGWFIIHYDALVTAKYLLRPVFDVLIADEAHRLRNKANKWTKAIKRITAARIIALTATPMDKRVGEYWSILDFLKVPGVPYYNAFKVLFEKWGNEGFYPKYLGPKLENLPALQAILSRNMVKHTKQEVAPELPAHIIIPTSVAMTAKQQELFEQIDKSEDILVDGLPEHDPMIIQNALVKIVRLQQIGSDPSLLDFGGGSGKLEWLDEFIEDHPYEKIAIFTKFRGTALCIQSKYQCAMVIGGIVPWKLDEFKKGNYINLLVGTIAGMGIGLDLPMATYSVFVDMEWSTLQMQQAYDRIHRLGITETKISYLLLSNKIDTLIYRAVEHKWSEIELVQAFLHGV